MRKKLIAGLLVFTMIATVTMPVMAAAKAKKIAIKGKKTVAVGSTIELDSVITPKKAKIKDRNIIWTSSKPSVAKVLEKRDDDTKIKGMKAGTATITVRIKVHLLKEMEDYCKKRETSTAAAVTKINTYKAEAKNLKSQINKLILQKQVRRKKANIVI